MKLTVPSPARGKEVYFINPPDYWPTFAWYLNIPDRVCLNFALWVKFDTNIWDSWKRSHLFPELKFDNF